jgi:hypothetical protein
MLLDPSGSRRVRSMRIHAGPHPKHRQLISNENEEGTKNSIKIFFGFFGVQHYRRLKLSMTMQSNVDAVISLYSFKTFNLPRKWTLDRCLMIPLSNFLLAILFDWQTYVAFISKQIQTTVKNKITKDAPILREFWMPVDRLPCRRRGRCGPDNPRP